MSEQRLSTMYVSGPIPLASTGCPIQQAEIPSTSIDDVVAGYERARSQASEREFRSELEHLAFLVEMLMDDDANERSLSVGKKVESLHSRLAKTPVD